MNNINDAMKKLQESRDRVAETLPKFIYDLDKDGAWSAREPSKTLGGKIFYKIDRNGSSSLTNDELIKAVLDKFPELKLYDGFRNDGDIITFIKKEVNESCDIQTEVNKLKTVNEAMKKLQESKKLKENVNWDFYNNKIKNMVHKYLPDREENETLASQIVVVIKNLVYAWNNDGDVYDNVHSNLKGWINDISSYANWLYKYVDGTQDTLKKIYDMSNNKNDYENLLKEIVDKFLDDDFLAQAAKSKEEGNIYDCSGPFEFKYKEPEDEDEEDEEKRYEVYKIYYQGPWETECSEIVFLENKNNESSSDLVRHYINEVQNASVYADDPNFYLFERYTYITTVNESWPKYKKYKIQQEELKVKNEEKLKKAEYNWNHMSIDNDLPVNDYDD